MHSEFPGVAEANAPARELRLENQLEAVKTVMADGEWRTLEQVRTDVLDRFGIVCPTPSVSTRLRDLRKLKNGAHEVERKHLGNGLFSYKLTLRIPLNA